MSKLRRTWLSRSAFAGAVALAFFVIATLHRRHEVLSARHAESEAQLIGARRKIMEAEEQILALLNENRRLLRDRAELPKLRGEVTMLRRELREQIELPQRVATLRSAFERDPVYWIPGINNLPAQSWSQAVTLPVETQNDLWRAMGIVRKTAVKGLASELRYAITEFRRETGMHPQTLQDLLPFLSDKLRQQVLDFCVAQPLPSGAILIQSKTGHNRGFGWSLEVDPDSYLYRISNGHQ